MDPVAALQEIEHIRSFLLAGQALFTLVSKPTGRRYTFSVEAAPRREGHEDHGYFVRLLAGPDNSSDYRYLGFLWGRPARLFFKANKEGWGEEALRAFSWLLDRINSRQAERFHEQAEFWHAGRCGRCGRVLTTPESIVTGLGPVCAGKE